jgi:hypothetical protein
VAKEGSCGLVAEVNELNRGLKSDFLWHVMDLSFGIEPRFKGWMSGCQHNERSLALRSQASHLSGVIARLLRLFQGRVLFSLHPD